jgi:hypothetical protein
MGTSLEEQTASDIRMPRAGTIGVYAITTATSIDLTTGGMEQGGGQSAQFNGNMPPANVAPSTANSPGGGGTVQSLSPMNPVGWVGRWIDITVDAGSGAGDLGIISGPTLASVTSANAPAIATTGVPGTAGNCYRIPAGTKQSFIPRADDRYIGVVSSTGTCTFRISASGR